MKTLRLLSALCGLGLIFQSAQAQILPGGTLNLNHENGIYIQCTEEIIDEISGNVANYHYWDYYRDLLVTRHFDYLADYDLENAILPDNLSDCSYTPIREARLDEIFNWYMEIKQGITSNDPVGVPRPVKIGLIVDQYDDWPITGTCDFYISTTGEIPSADPCVLNADASFNRSSTNLTDSIISWLNNVMNPGHSPTKREVIKSEYIKSAARAVIPFYSKSDGDVTIVNPVAAHPISSVIEVLTLEHEYWRWDRAFGGAYANANEAWDDHLDILAALRYIICLTGRNNLLLEDYAFPKSYTGSSQVGDRDFQAAQIDKFVDQVNIVAFHDSPFSAVEDACSEIAAFAKNSKMTKFRPLVNVWEKNDSTYDCFGIGDTIQTELGIGPYLKLGNSINKTENDIYDEYRNGVQGGVVGPTYFTSCTEGPGFGDPTAHNGFWSVQFLGTMWNDLSHLGHYQFARVAASQNQSIQKGEISILISNREIHYANLNDKDYVLEVIDATGRIVEVKKFPSNNGFAMTLLPEINPGIYIFRLTGSSQTVAKKYFIQ